MQKMRFWSYFQLCLCLVFSFLLVSCAIKREGKPADKLITKDTAAYFWKLEVLVIPVKWFANTPVDNLDILIQPCNIRRLTGNSSRLILSFRANDFGQVQLLREQLLATGIVQEVNIIKELN